MGYIGVWEHSRGNGNNVVDWSLIFEDLYSLELGFMDICVTNVFPFLFQLHRIFEMHPHHSLCTLVDY